MPIPPLIHYAECSDLERRLHSIALTIQKQKHFGEKPDMRFCDAARALGLHDEKVIDAIRRCSVGRWEVIRRINSRCIFEVAANKNNGNRKVE